MSVCGMMMKLWLGRHANGLFYSCLFPRNDICYNFTIQTSSLQTTTSTYRQRFRFTCSLGVSPVRLFVASLAATDRPTNQAKEGLAFTPRSSVSRGATRGPPSFVFNLLLAGLYTGCLYLLPSGITATAFMQTPGAVNMISSLCMCSGKAYRHGWLYACTTATAVKGNAMNDWGGGRTGTIDSHHNPPPASIRASLGWH
jgi:hypothetical protein